MKIPFGYYQEEKELKINPASSKIIKCIFDLYLSGESLGSITEKLARNKILTPTGKEKWSRSVIDTILSNPVYIPGIISEEQYYKAQYEKECRSNQKENTNKTRKATRYHSKNVLSGLLFCSECGAPYRRITRPTGEIVWRCANRVEHGKLLCRKSQSISEEVLQTKIKAILPHIDLNKTNLRETIERVEIISDEKILPIFVNL